MIPRWLRLRPVMMVMTGILVALALWFVVASRGERDRDDKEDKAAIEGPKSAPENRTHELELDEATQRSGGIVTATLTASSLAEEVRAWATVVDLQPLTEFYSRYRRAKSQVEVLQAKLTASRAEFERNQRLYKNGQNVSAAELQKAEAAFRVDEAELNASQSELRTIALAAQQSWGDAIGEAAVNDAPLITRLLARQDVLLQVTLRPGQALAQPLDGAALQIDGGAREPLSFISAATTTDPRLQGPSFFFTTPGSGGLLRGMSVVALLPSGLTVEGAVVPGSAVVWEGGRAWVYIRTGPKTFERHPITTKNRGPDGGYIVSDLPNPVDMVITGAQMLLSQEFRAQTRAGDQGDED